MGGPNPLYRVASAGDSRRGWPAGVYESGPHCDDGAASGRTRAAILLSALVFALLLVLPRQTVTTTYVNDLFIFLDGAYRVASGQVPNRDFHTALGPLVYYLPALGYRLSGNLGGAIPSAMAILIVGFAPVMVHVLGSRLKPVIAVPFGVFVLLILAVPINLGESIRSLSFAMFYNRVGWAALAMLLVMYVQPARSGRGQDWADLFSAAVLTLVMVYTKLTYGLVALAFLVFMLSDRHQRRWAAGSIGGTILAALAIELIWRASLAHLADLLLAGRVSGLRVNADLALGFLRHLADYVMFGMVAGLLLWLRRSWRDFLFFGFCAGAGLLIMIQNSQPWGIISLHAGAAAGVEMLVRPDPHRARASWLAAGAPVLLLALLLPTALHCFVALGLHAGLGATRSGEPFGLPGYDRVRLARLWAEGDDPFSTGYLAAIRDGAEILKNLPKPKHVSVLDFANPFSAGLGLAPPRRDSAWLHWGRNVDAEHHLSGEQLLGGVELLMEPKWGINNIPLSLLYGSYIQASFEPIRDDAFWTVYRRRNPDETSLRPGSVGVIESEP